MTQGFDEMLNQDRQKSISKFKGRKIIDYVLAKKPDFDPSKHKVLVNDFVVDQDRLGDKLGPLDVILVRDV